jgi:arsenic resistance protein ArsH
MKPSSYFDRVVERDGGTGAVTVLMRLHIAQLTDRYSERNEDAAKLAALKSA